MSEPREKHEREKARDKGVDRREERKEKRVDIDEHVRIERQTTKDELPPVYPDVDDE